MKIFLLSFFFLSVHCIHLNRGIQSQTEKFKQSDWHLQITKTNKAWSLSKGSKDIVVAIIDTGIDVHHPDLKKNLWVNLKEAQGSPGVDDDQNGYVDDIHGWNFADNNNNLWDDHGHGTHVAGIIGGTGQVCKPGIAPKVQLMALKYYDSDSSGNQNLKNTIEAIRYAINNGAHIINFSGGGYEPSQQEKLAIADAFLKDILFVAAAGNDKKNLENKPYYPASYKLPNIFSVASTDSKDHHSNFSNLGGNISAHAPGDKIFSTLPPSRCGILTGTSQATPIFTGGAVLLKASKPKVQAVDIVNYLKKTTDNKDHLRGKSESSGRANIYRALGSEHFNVTVNETPIEYSENQKIGQHHQESESSQTPSQNSQDLLNFMTNDRFTKTQEVQKQPRNPASLSRNSFFKSIEIQTEAQFKDGGEPFSSPQENLDALKRFLE